MKELNPQELEQVVGGYDLVVMCVKGYLRS